MLETLSCTPWSLLQIFSQRRNVFQEGKTITLGYWRIAKVVRQTPYKPKKTSPVYKTPPLVPNSPLCPLPCLSCSSIRTQWRRGAEPSRQSMILGTKALFHLTNCGDAIDFCLQAFEEKLVTEFINSMGDANQKRALVGRLDQTKSVNQEIMTICDEERKAGARAPRAQLQIIGNGHCKYHSRYRAYPTSCAQNFYRVVTNLDARLA